MRPAESRFRSLAFGCCVVSSGVAVHLVGAERETPTGGPIGRVWHDMVVNSAVRSGPRDSAGDGRIEAIGPRTAERRAGTSTTAWRTIMADDRSAAGGVRNDVEADGLPADLPILRGILSARSGRWLRRSRIGNTLRASDNAGSAGPGPVSKEGNRAWARRASPLRERRRSGCGTRCSVRG